LRKTSERILLGFEVPSGEPVHIPLHHLVITGMTQLSGKTTTIEALIHRSGLRAVVFKTKRGETGFETAGRTLPLYFKERSDWRYVSSLIEATLREKVKFERSWVIRACRGTRTLREVYNRVVDFLESKKLRALDRSVFTNLQAYLELVLPEIERLPTTDKIEIGSGVNVMDLEVVYHRPEVQALIIRSVMEHILEKERNIVVVVPEAWKFLPQGQNTPVKIFFERFIREGAAIGNYLWVDSQDIAGTDKAPLRQVDNWILGRQREEHEVERTLEAIPLPKSKKPTTLEIRRLNLGHFYAACGDQVRLVYVLPAEIPEEIGRQVAIGKLPPDHVKKMLDDLRSREEVDEVWRQRYEELEKQFNNLKSETTKLTNNVADLKNENEKLLKEKALFDKSKEMMDTYEEKTKDLTRRLEKAEGDLKLFNELREILVNIFPGSRFQIPAGAQKDIDLVHVETTVNISHREEAVSMSTSTVLGKILYIAINDLSREGWSEKDLSEAMKEHGWNVGHSTLAPNLGNLVKQGHLIRIAKTRPTRYKLPSKLKVNVEKE